MAASWTLLVEVVIDFKPFNWLGRVAAYLLDMFGIHSWCLLCLVCLQHALTYTDISQTAVKHNSQQISFIERNRYPEEVGRFKGRSND